MLRIEVFFFFLKNRQTDVSTILQLELNYTKKQENSIDTNLSSHSKQLHLKLEKHTYKSTALQVLISFKAHAIFQTTTSTLSFTILFDRDF